MLDFVNSILSASNDNALKVTPRGEVVYHVARRWMACDRATMPRTTAFYRKLACVHLVPVLATRPISGVPTM